MVERGVIMATEKLDSKQIDEKALALLQTVFGDVESIKLPIDLNQIVKHCGLTIRQGRFSNSNLEGALDRQSKTIFLSEDDSFESKNFTLAHEIGHFKLHEDVKTDIFTMYQLKSLLIRQGEDSKEDQADMFAASLLMPARLIKSLWEATNKNVESVAKIFGVPPIAAKFRLKELGLL